jgi:FkbM family methyltransferase
MNIKNKMLQEKFYTLGGNLMSFENVDFDQTQSDVEYKYGWEACMYWCAFKNEELSLHPDCSVKAGDVFVDLGANIGMSSRYAERIGAKEIHCFEPDPRVFGCLEKNKGDNWKIYNKAISEIRGKFEIGLWPEIKEFVEVESVSLKDVFSICGLEKIDFLKVDVEGCERSMFNRVTDEELRKIDRIFVEWHKIDGITENANEKFRDAFMNRFNQAGYNAFVYLGYQDLIYFWRI